MSELREIQTRIPPAILDIQPARHPVPKGPFDYPLSNVIREIDAGDPYAHIWYGQAVDRIKQGPRPVLIVPDGLATEVHEVVQVIHAPGVPYVFDIVQPSKLEVAALIPAWPGEMAEPQPGETDLMLVVGADCIPPGHQYPFRGTMDLYGQLGDDETRMVHDLIPDKVDAALSVINMLVGAGIISAAAITAAKAAARARSAHRVQPEAPPETGGVLSRGAKRRSLIKIAGVVTGVLGLGAVGGLVGAADELAERAPNNMLKNLMLEIADVVDPDEMAKARNAMILLKADDAAVEAATIFPNELSSMPEIRATIPVGLAHANGMMELAESEAACQDAIRRYVKSLLPAIEKTGMSGIADGAMEPAKAKKWIIDKLVDYLAATSISRITDPQIDPATGEYYTDWLERAVQPVTVFRSKKVLQALEGIHL